MRKICLALISTFSLLSFSELDSLNQLQKQAADLAAGASSGSRDLEAADYLMGKFLFGKDGKATWYPEYYPTSSQMEPGSGVRPRVKLFKPYDYEKKALYEVTTSKGKFYLTEDRAMALRRGDRVRMGTSYAFVLDVKKLPDLSGLLAPLFEVFKKKNPSGSCEINLNPPYLSFGSLAGTEYCMEEAKQYDVDETTLASLQKLSNLSDPAQVQSAFVSVLNMDALSEEQKNKLMTDPNASIKTILDGLSSAAQKQALFDPRRVQLKSYVSDPSNPFQLGAIQAQVGGISVDIPVDPPPCFDPNAEEGCQLACQVQVTSPQPIQLNRNNEAEVRFHLKANSVVTAADVSLDNGKEGRLEEDDFLPYKTSQFGTFHQVSKTEVVLKLTKADLEDARINRANAVYLNGNRKQQVWKVTGKVFGVDSMAGHQSCDSGILIDFPLEPECSMTVSNAQILQGESTQVSLNCGSGGPVTAVQINTLVNGVVQASRPHPLPNPDPNQNYIISHTRLSPASGEVIQAVVTGLSATGMPSNVKTYTVPLGDVCPYNDTAFFRTEFTTGQFFRSDAHASGNALGDLTFTNGARNYTSNNRYFRAEGAKRPNLVTGCVDPNTGNWNGCWGDEAFETCNGDNICMMIGHMGDANYNWYVAGSHVYWIEVGKSNLSDGGKYDPQCKVQKTRMRFGGCFAKDTQLMMANGSYKSVTDIGEDELLWNPHYQAPVRIKKIVKGPEKKSLYEVKTSKGKVEVTEDHPFLTGRGWVQAMALKKGDKLLGNGEPNLVSRVTKLKYQGPQDVWNFELDSDDPMAHVVIANGVPTGDLVTQLELKKPKAKLP